MIRRPSSSAENSYRNPEIIEDSDEDVEEPSIDIPSDDDGGVVQRTNGLRRKNVISDSDEEDEPAIASRRNSVAAVSSDGASADGRSTPFLGRLIRRSIHRIKHESEAEESDELSEPEDFEQVQPEAANNIDAVETSDEESDVSSEHEDSEELPRKKDDVVHSIESSVEEHSEDDIPEIEQVRDSPLPESNKKIDRKEIERKIRRSIHNVAPYVDENSDVSDESVQSIAQSESSIEQHITVNDDSIPAESSVNSSSEVAANVSVSSEVLALAKEETGNTVTDPVLAQKRAYLTFQQQSLETKLAKSKKLYNGSAINALPDGGEKLRLSIASTEKALMQVKQELSTLPMTVQMDVKPKLSPLQRMNQIKEEVKQEAKPFFKQDSFEIDPAYMNPTTRKFDKELGKKARETFEREQALTVERLQDLHGSLLARPAEDERAKDPRGLKVPLMPHQQHALAWLMWREQKKPRGGVLADDMGLGKTLTMISLVMTANANGNESDEDEDEWHSNARGQRYLGGTLVVAPASLVAQWESEVKNRCKRGLLMVELYHGNNRETVAKRLAKNDMVITTYRILMGEFKANGTLYKIRWRRVILDEAHVIRNHKSQTCESVCGLQATRRWALTGTPIQNKEMDLYSILKFLQCSPFDDLRVWKRWVDNRNDAGQERLATVMKSLMLRRTKQELMAKGALKSLPAKSIEIINVDLDPEERLVYDKVMVYSRTLFAQFLAQRAEKAHMFELEAGKYDKPSWTMTHKDTQFTKAQNQLLSMHADVQSHEILVLLLRLRQVCCHPSLIHSMLDREDIEVAGAEEGVANIDLMARMNKMNIKSDATEEEEGDIGVDERVAEHLLTSDNPVFDANRQSSKMRAVLDKIEEIIENDDKVIVVSQWVSVLDIIANELEQVENATFQMFTGKVAVKDRQGIMNDFNKPHEKTNVLLLSLNAGGVGLNLVGANHLLLVDIHWNPQLESQAQDRIYRFGQTKDVYIYKYICNDTIEERIQALQDKKLALATAVLSGGGKVVGSKLSLDDIKSLFSL